MIEQGTDGLSRGNLNEGVMTGASMLSFVPLNKGALDRRPELLDWIAEWVPYPHITVLSCEDWYEKGHGVVGGCKNSEGIWMPKEMEEGWLLWSPPPAIAEVAVEELEVSRHKRKHINHIFVAPRLMTYHWRKKLQKVSDLVFEVPAGSREFWPVQEHEPLIVGLTLRFSSSSPWQVKRTGCVLELERLLREVWKSEDRDERSLLQQFCNTPRRMATV